MQKVFLICFLAWSTGIMAQGPISGFMPPRGETAIALSYTSESFNEYNFGEMTADREREQTAYSLFVEHGFSDSFALVFTLPYLKVDEINRGLQDASLHIKYRNKHGVNTNGQSNVITAIGIRAPISRYPIDNDNAIGIRAAVFEGRLVWQYQWFSGAFLHLQSGFDFRFAPSAQTAVPIILRSGYGGKHFYVDGWIERYHTFANGTDVLIGGLNGSRWWRVGATLYIPATPKLGAFVGINRILGGQNIGLSTGLNLGAVVKL